MQALLNDLLVDPFRFRGAHTVGAATSQFRQAKTGTPGAIVAGNTGLILPIAATNEAECNRMEMVVKPYRIQDLVWVSFLVAVSELGANSHAAFGLCNTPADNPDSIDEGVWFKVLADNSVVLESDDGVTDVDDIATGITLGTTYHLFYLDLRNGVWSNDPRSGGSYGGDQAIQASVMNSTTTKLRPVARGTRFTLGAATGPLQVFAQITKGSSTDSGNLYVREINVCHKNTLYAAV